MLSHLEHRGWVVVDVALLLSTIPTHFLRFHTRPMHGQGDTSDAIPSVV
jgi:hypothetical protein